jgi:hypothetical protein
MASTPASLKWSAQLHIAPSNRRLVGDKITLPQSALEALLAAAPVVSVQNNGTRALTSSFDPFNPYSFAAERRARELIDEKQQQLPNPLTFRLVNPLNGRAVHAGIREFSAADGTIGLSPGLQEALGIPATSSSSTVTTREGTPTGDVLMTDDNDAPKGPLVTIHAQALKKGTFVKLRPLEAGYDPADWKSLLERYLRDNYTTLTKGELLVVPGAHHEKFRFLVDKFEPDEEGVCIVDTDLEVDIEPLNEEQARETLKRRLAKSKREHESPEGSSIGGLLQVNAEKQGKVLPGQYVDYDLKAWDRTQDLELSLTAANDDSSLNLLAIPFSSRHRSKPREDEHVFGDLSVRPTKRLKISHTNVDVEEAEYLSIAVHAWTNRDAETKDSARLIPYTIQVSVGPSHMGEGEEEPAAQLSPDDVICKNCRQVVPKRTLHLHEAFCYRNNVLCPKCSGVFLKNSEAWKNHWHCPHDNEHGNDVSLHEKHDAIFHPQSPLQCPSCEFQAFDMPILAQHRTTNCPGKEILCQFCHLIVPQQGPEDPSFTDPEVLMSGLTPHELADGARTTECHLCSKIVRLRDMKTHLRLHDRERFSRPTPKLCSNYICGRTIRPEEESRVHKEQLDLCNECFGPLYVTAYDPEGKMLRRRIERRMLQQLTGGCSKAWCRNLDYCRSAHKNQTGTDRIISAKDGLAQIKPIIDGLARGETSSVVFCVDEASQSRRSVAEMISGEGEYQLGWCVKALEEEKGDLDRAREWLKNRAPKVNEVIV